MKPLLRLLLAALLLFGVVPLSYGNVDYASLVNVLSVHGTSYDKLTKKGRAEIANDIKKFTLFVKKISAKAPKKYRGQIDLQRVAYERLRNSGLSDKQASLALQNPKLQSLLAVTDDIAGLAKRHGGIRNVPDADLYMLMKFTVGNDASSGKSVELSKVPGTQYLIMILLHSETV